MGAALFLFCPFPIKENCSPHEQPRRNLTKFGLRTRARRNEGAHASRCVKRVHNPRCRAAESCSSSARLQGCAVGAGTSCTSNPAAASRRRSWRADRAHARPARANARPARQEQANAREMHAEKAREKPAATAPDRRRLLQGASTTRTIGTCQVAVLTTRAQSVAESTEAMLLCGSAGSTTTGLRHMCFGSSKRWAPHRCRCSASRRQCAGNVSSPNSSGFEPQRESSRERIIMGAILSPRNLGWMAR